MATELKVKILPHHPGQVEVLNAWRSGVRFLWLCAGRKWFKTSLAVEPAVVSALRGGRVFWGAPTNKQLNDGWELCRAATHEVAIPYESRPKRLDFITKGRIVFDSVEEPNNARGPTWDGVIFDEVSLIRPEAFYEVILPILAYTRGWFLGLFTPRGKNWVWREWMKAHDRPDSRAWQIPSCGCEILNGQLIRRPHALENPFFPFEEMERDFAEFMPIDVFRQEYLAEFIEGAGSVFRGVDTCACLPQGFRGNGPYIIGLDIAKHEDFSVLIAINPQGQVCFFDRFQKLDWLLQEQRIERAAKDLGARIVMETNGPGDPLADLLASKGLDIVPYYMTSASKDNLIRGLSLSLEKQEISYPQNPTLQGELKAYGYRQSSTGRYSYSAPEGMHDDCVIALALADWGRKAYSSEPIEPQLGISEYPEESEEESSKWVIGLIPPESHQGFYRGIFH